MARKSAATAGQRKGAEALLRPVVVAAPGADDPHVAPITAKPAGAVARLWCRTRLWVLGCAFVVVCTIGVLALVVTSLVHAAPPWWSGVTPDDPATVDLATRLENAVFSQLSLQRDTADEIAQGVSSGPWRSDDWTVSMKDDHANAWLKTRLPAWLAGQDDVPQWPHNLGDLQISFAPTHINIGVSVKADRRSQVLSATLVPELRDDGSLWLYAHRVYVGRLPIPASWVLDEVESRSVDILPASMVDLPGREAFFSAFQGRNPMAQSPVIKLPDGRAVRLLGLRARDGSILITCRTELD